MPKKQFESDMSSPEEFAAWAFAAGVPDPRGDTFGYQPLIPAPCFPKLSKMLWDFGFRHHADLQTHWVADYSGPDRNLVALGVTDISPEAIVEQATEMLAEQFPEVAAHIAQMTEENREQVIAERVELLRASLEKLREATNKLEGGALA